MNRRCRRLKAPEAKTLDRFLRDFGIGPHDWDFVLIGDGSGSNWGREASWASVSIERLTMERLVWYGAVNRGTVNIAELSAIIFPLLWLLTREKERRKRPRRPPTTTATQAAETSRVHIFTDSIYCREMGQKTDRTFLGRYALLWQIVDQVTAEGFTLFWHWIPRDRLGLHVYCDRLAKMSRQLLKNGNLQEIMEQENMTAGGHGTTVYDINPSEMD